MGGLLSTILESAFCRVPAGYSALNIAGGSSEKWSAILDLFDIWG